MKNECRVETIENQGVRFLPFGIESNNLCYVHIQSTTL